MSHWTNFLSEKFVNTYKSKAELCHEWEKELQCLFDALAVLTP